MKIATVMNVHADIPCVLDTIDALKTYVTEDILVLVDGVAWDKFKNVDLGVAKVKGFPHGKPKSPYRNVALALSTLIDLFPNHDWYHYTEFDVLFCSDRFKKSLKLAEEMKVWMLGNDGHVDSVNMQLVEALIKDKFKSNYYLIGCCQFFHKDFINKLKEINFFEKFLNLTNSFSDGYFPLFNAYDISEHMYPTLCRHFGGNIGVFAHYDEYGNWHGSYKIFPVRWKPEINPETENFAEASIMHPIKTFLFLDLS